MIGRKFGFNCPHCEYKMTTTMSRPLNPLLQERYLKCNNPKCAAVYKAFVELSAVVNEPLDQTDPFND